MDKNLIETELLNQRKRLEQLLHEKCLTRFAVRHLDFDLPLQLVCGVRGAGKTFSLVHALAARDKTFAYADMSRFKRGLDFEGLYESLAMVYGEFDTVVLDECYGVTGIEDVFKRFVESGIAVIGVYSGLHDLVITGFEAAPPVTAFYPLSFSEYCIWHGVDTENSTPTGIASVRKAFNDFLNRGGFPSMQQKMKLTRTRQAIENAIISNDIRGVFRKDMMPELHETAALLLENSSGLINYKKIAEHIGLGSEITAKKYVEAVKGSGCVSVILRFGQADRQRTIFEKVYVADPSFISEDNRQQKMEACVYMQLRRFCERHGYRMHYYANRTTECDFALCVDRKMRTIIQIISDYSDTESIREKVRGLIALSKETGCNRLFILTDSSHDTITSKGLTVTVVPAYEFLLDRSHKIVSD